MEGTEEATRGQKRTPTDLLKEDCENSNKASRRSNQLAKMPENMEKKRDQGGGERESESRC